MALFDFLTGRKGPVAGATKQSVSHLRAMLLALNRDTAPWTVRDGAPEGCDLVAEWKIVDARWYEIFAKANLTKVAQIRMRIDSAEGEVRNVMQDWTVEWRAGVPTLSLSAEAFRGQKVEASFGKGFAFREDDLTYGKVYDYRFDSREMTGPLIDLVTGAGWAWKPVAFRKL